jgi:hypothetical protein
VLDVHEAIVFLACPKGEVVKYKPKSRAMLHHPQVEVKQNGHSIVPPNINDLKVGIVAPHKHDGCESWSIPHMLILDLKPQ